MKEILKNKKIKKVYFGKYSISLNFTDKTSLLIQAIERGKPLELNLYKGNEEIPIIKANTL